MKYRNLVLATILLTVMAEVAATASPSVTTPRLVKNTPGRQEYLLNGLYHFRVFERMPGPADHATGSGIYARIPGEWFNFLGHSDQFVDRQGKTLPRFPGADAENWRKTAVCGLYELDFAVPSAAGKIVLLNIAGCQYRAEVYFNGTRLGSQIKYENNYYNITPLLRSNASDNLRIALQGFMEENRPYAGLVRNPVYAGIVEDVKLLVLDHGLLCRFTGLRTDLAAGKAFFTVTTDNYTGRDAAGVMRLKLAGSGNHSGQYNVAAKLPPGRSQTEIAVPLTGLLLWEPETPNLYTVSLDVIAPNGISIASIPPASTGFRQVAIKGSQFYLNHHVATLFGDSAARISHLPSHCAGVFPDQTFACLHALGYNFANLLDYLTPEASLRAADRHGVMLMPVLKFDADKIFRRHAVPPALTTLNGKTVPEAEIVQFEKQFRDLNEYYALHPSVIGYARNFNWLCDVEKAYQPQRAGRRETVANERADFAAEILRRTAAIDPSKLHYHHHGGGFGPVYTHNRYWSIGLPLQEKCDFPKLWAEGDPTGKLPYLVTEGYMYSGWPSIYPKWGVSSRNPKWIGFHGRPFMLREIGAVQLGPWAYFSNQLESRTMTEDHMINIRRQTAAYRYYGVMGHMLHTDTYRGYVPGQIIPQAEPVGANVSGLVSRADLRIWQREHPSTQLTPLGETLRHAFSGFTFFLMGNPANPTEVAHNFYAGTPVEKSLLVINETGLRRQLDFPVTLADRQRIFWQTTVRVELAPGQRRLIPLRLLLPEVEDKTTLTLTAVLDRQRESFDLTVFPRRKFKFADAGRQVAFYDQDGSLKNMLDFYGLTAAGELSSRSSMTGVKLLVVGRNGLSIAFGRLAVRLKIGDWLRHGGRMIVLEQSGENVLGLNTDPRRARNVFIAVPHHPALAGLRDADLADWQGKSSLLGEFPAPAPGFHFGDPLITSTTGTVSSLPLEKPHLGSFLPLLESGYDLQFSPLLEWRDGQGLLLLSQLDLTGRIGIEPAATRLLGNLLQYALTVTPDRSRPVFYAGDAVGKALLQPYLPSCPDLSAHSPIPAGATLIAGGGAEKFLTAGALKDWLNGGGVLLCLPSFDALSLLPVKITPEPVNVSRAYATFNAALSRTLPLSLSDLYWHDNFKFTGWQAAGRQNNPLVDEIPYGAGKIVYCRIAPKSLQGHYFQMKIFRLWSVLLTYCGVSQPPMLAGRLADCGANSVIPLGNNAWFRLDPQNQGLKQRWMEPELPMTSPWKKIVTPGAWEKTPYLENFGPPDPPPAAAGYDGIAWYRFEINLPAALAGRPALLKLGVVDDYDCCYFNGVKIGGMSKAFGPSVCTTPRIYRIPEKLIRHDRPNVIAVRVEDTSGDGGIMSGRPCVEFFAGKSLKADMYRPDLGIMDVFGITPYYNEQW